MDRGRAVTWDPVSRGRFRVVGFVVSESARSVRDGGGAGFLLPGTLWRVVEGDFSAAGRLGGNGRLRGNRPEVAPEGGVDFLEIWCDRTGAAVAVAIGSSLSAVLR
ncbi:hypothetical protein W59_01094 [Rhodococcus opacus RKJ300 = JCM 13270]|uniref:Uncharacterized protein n=1 Tax=Rhodococcus opacus RKJ300 = JCM 13270 TaxID=1165867 RepID=I0WZR0_RHOOP|nr:hypothetical protein W59_01094 [Rhodococcus opacus RKJ300 = JCM 13270]